VECLGIHVVLRFVLCETHDKRGHGHFDVEFHYVDDWMELNVYDWVLQEHEADEEALPWLVSSNLGNEGANI